MSCLFVQVREPQPLTLHHLPFSHTFALFEVRHCWLLLLQECVLQLTCDPVQSSPAVASSATTVSKQLLLCTTHCFMLCPPPPPPVLRLQSGAILVSDPTLSEEAASSGRVTLFINPHDEICGWQMAEGVGLDQAQMMR